MLNMLLSQAKDYYGQYLLDLSGEIIIQNSNKTERLALGQKEYDLLNSCVKTLSTKLPFLKIEKRDSLVEYRVSLFAMGQPSCHSDLLEIVRTELEGFAKTALTDSGLRVSMNVFGIFNNGLEKQTYRMLNNGQQVEYLITDSCPVSMVAKLTGHRIKAYAVTFVLGILLLDMCYEALIAGHGWRLTNIFELFHKSYVPASVNPKDVV